MLQSGPYPFRTLERCLCHAPCADWVPPGKFLWILAENATGAFERYRDPFKLMESNAFLACTWDGSEAVPFEGGFIIYEAAYRYAKVDPPATGVPRTIIVDVGARLQIPPHFNVWQAQATLLVEEQWDCRETFDLDPLPNDMSSGTWFPQPTGVNGTLLTKWGGAVSPFS